MIKIKHLKPKEIWLVDLPKNNGSCLEGKHPCIVIRRFGRTVQVIPISENKNNVHFADILIDKGKFNLKKNSKLKVSQYTSVPVENFIHIIGKSDLETSSKIKNFIQKHILSFL